MFHATLIIMSRKYANLVLRFKGKCANLVLRFKGKCANLVFRFKGKCAIFRTEKIAICRGEWEISRSVAENNYFAVSYIVPGIN